MATMVAEPYVNHIPTMTGGTGADALSRFYAEHFIPKMPKDTTLTPLSRTVGADRVVDEMIFSFTHNEEIDWMLPGVAPTGKTVSVPLVAIVAFRGNKLYHEHIYWDQASVLVQSRLAGAARAAGRRGRDRAQGRGRDAAVEPPDPRLVGQRLKAEVNGAAGAWQPMSADGPSLGKALERVEDAALLMGCGRYIDDLPVAPGTGHAAILRSPHPHARLLGIDTAAARALPGVHAVITGEDARAWSTPFIVGVRQPMEHWCIATDRVRYAGEPVAIVVAEDRYRAEDALALIDVRYEPLPAVVDPEAALEAGAPVLHEAVGSNLISERAFRYGEPEAAFAEAVRTVETTVRYPRNSCTPIECLGLIAAYDPGEGVYDVLSNFQGPMTLHPVMARALKVPGPRLRLRSVPDLGGSFGVKQAIFPLIVAMALAARKAARPVKWIEDRLEHLLAANAATNRVTRIEAAVDADGRVAALRLDQLGGLRRLSEGARARDALSQPRQPHRPLSRVAHLAVTNRVVVTNKTPTGLNRGFGGPQLYYALERLMQRVRRDPRPRPAGR